MRFPIRTVAAIVGTMAVIVSTTAFVPDASAALAAPTSTPAIRVLDGDVSSQAWDELLPLSTSNPNDHCECLYVPEGTRYTEDTGVPWTITQDGPEPDSFT